MRSLPAAVLVGGRALADLVLPRVCGGCGVPGAVLCGSCRRLLTRPRLAQPRRHPPGFPPTVAAGAYAGPVRPAVLAFKEHGRAELAGPLGTALALAVAAVLDGLPEPPAGSGPVLLVPVPSSAAAVRHRGRDHVRELADVAGAELCAAGVPARTVRLLGRVSGRRVRDSAGLGAVERRANLAGRFRALPLRAALPPGSRLVLVDDVVTSGATLTEAARALACNSDTPGPWGDTPVLAAVVAATPRRARRPLPVAGPGAFTRRR
ncbi:MAG TPA: ComF family protein [Modestobacter sp.]|nr:ComF family protein [Modestobacter sp.]